MQRDTLLLVRVVCLREEAPGIVSCEMRTTGEALPECAPGSHIDVHLPNGLVRQYSVVSADARHVRIAVKREPRGRGGSAYVADALRLGTVLNIGHPRENFPLAQGEHRTVLIAGGIGLTAVIAMARALAQRGGDWVLHYCLRSRDGIAFADELAGWGERVRIHVSSETGRAPLESMIEGEPAGTHFYCCGPESMLQDFARATASLPPDRVHVERFEAARPPQDAGAFRVRLARSGREIAVRPDQTILDAIAAEGIDAPSSCQQGICGSCEVAVLEGTPEHRDEVLTESERARGTSMMICCSRSRSEVLVLDL
jgi:vanillate O-demethylase ferredoxin subunit